MGYFEHKFLLSFALDDLSERGLPVDRAMQDKLRAHIDSEDIRLLAEIQTLVPDELHPLHPKGGYKGMPKDLRSKLKELDLIIKKAGPLDYFGKYGDVCASLGYVVRLMEDGEYRLVKLLDFNPNSAQQLIAYIKYKGYRVPKHIDTGRDTVGKEALAQLIAETDDDVLKLAQKMKKLSKIGGTYAAGSWIPGDDGCVHGTFRFGTAVGQTACVNPNIQQFPEHFDKDDEWISEIMRMVKGSIKAKPGHKLIKVDARSAHARMQGFLAEDPDYYRLASLDLHSYTTANYVGIEGAREWTKLADAELIPKLKAVKKEHEYVRNAMVKRVTYLMQYGGGAEKAATILRIPVVEVMALIESIVKLFPKTFKEFPRKIDAQMRAYPRLISPHGHCRWFWDHDLQQAIAFSVANPFHAHIQSALVRLFQQGVFQKYNAVNFSHDSLWMHPTVDLVDEAIAVVRAEMEKPSEILVNSLGAFWCSADAQVGDSLLEMEDV